MSTREIESGGDFARASCLVCGFARDPCLVCGVPFTFNPQRVPSYDAGRGKRPICRSCMERINEKRRAWGEDPHPIPEGAYEIPQGEP